MQDNLPINQPTKQQKKTKQNKKEAIKLVLEE